MDTELNREGIYLSSGGNLLQCIWSYDEDTEVGKWLSIDVSDKAEQYLFDDIEIGDNVTLADLFTLVEKSPVLKQVYRRSYINELAAHAQLGVNPNFTPGYSPDAIEYLELYQQWSFDSNSKTYRPLHNLFFHGVGYQLKEDVLETDSNFGYPAGHRIQWGLSFTDIRDLLQLPIKIKREVAITEDDLDAVEFGQVINVANLSGVSLGQVLHGVFWELSFFGGPEETKAVGDELKSQVAEIRSGDANIDDLEYRSIADLLFDRDQAGCNRMFSALGSFTPHEIYKVLRMLENDSIVGQSLNLFAEHGLVIKPEYAELTARAFRKLFREATDQSRKDSK